MTIDQAFELARKQFEAGQLAQAHAIATQIIGTQPNHAPTWNLLALINSVAGQRDAAVQAIQRAVTIDPSSPVFHGNLIELLRLAGRLDEAVAAGKRAIDLDAADGRARLILGTVYTHLGKLEDAREHFAAAVRLQPDLMEAHLNLGAILESLDRLEEATTVMEHALKLDPNSSMMWHNLGIVYCRHGRIDESLAAQKRSLELDPSNYRFHSHMIYTLLNRPNVEPAEVLRQHVDWAQRHAEPITRTAPPLTFDRDPDRKLTVGYVSPNFRQHAVAYFIEPFVGHHDQVRFKIIFYHDSPQSDEITARIKQHADVWREVANLDDEQLARQVREDRVDILVDLNGHIPRHRLLAFARKPAPVQVTYIGYQTTTGMSAMDYRITDAVADPPGDSDRFHTENLVRLPLFFCFSRIHATPPVGDLPADRNGYVTFGSMNHFVKVNADVIDLWAQLLKKVANSKLLILIAGGTNGNKRVIDEFERRGVEPSRIELTPMGDANYYLDVFNRIDIQLDPFPFSGHTTTLDSLWMGVPVVALRGNAYAGRMSASVLTAMGMTDWIAEDKPQYLQIAQHATKNLPRLRELRSTLRKRLEQSPCMDGTMFARNLEIAYRQMWRDKIE